MCYYRLGTSEMEVLFFPLEFGVSPVQESLQSLTLLIRIKSLAWFCELLVPFWGGLSYREKTAQFSLFFSCRENDVLPNLYLPRTFAGDLNKNPCQQTNNMGLRGEILADSFRHWLMAQSCLQQSSKKKNGFLISLSLPKLSFIAQSMPVLGLQKAERACQFLNCNTYLIKLIHMNLHHLVLMLVFVRSTVFF